MNRLLATITFFTRLPLWRLRDIPSECYKRVVELWPLAGWLTGGVTAAVLLVASTVLPHLPAVMLALMARVLLTGALHEDGLADFMDGMGGGTDRDRILSIMKDSHIGTYGVIGLIMYYMLLASVLASFPVRVAAMTIVCADAWSKCCSAQIINFLPYARTAEQAKNKTVYTRMKIADLIGCIILGALPLAITTALTGYISFIYSAIAPIITVICLIAYMRHKINGYTGDCCGATALISELSMYVTALALWWR